MEEAELGCSVCHERYEENRTPRNLGCGHSVCTTCVEEIINRSRKCPECRRPFYATMATALPINYPLLRLSRALAATGGARNHGEESGSPGARGQADAGECAAHLSRMVLRCMSCRVWVCRECLVMDHPVPPDGTCHVLPLRQALNEMKKVDVESTSAMVATLQALRKDAGEQAGRLDTNRKVHDDTVCKLRAVLQAELDLIQQLEGKKKEVADKMAEMDSWVQAVREKETAILQARTVRDLATAKLAARDCLNEVEARVSRERLRQARFMQNMPQFTTQNLRGCLQLAKAMYAMQESDGQRRWARITVHGSCLYVHALTNARPPPPTPVFSYSSLRTLVPREDATAFLELDWGEQTQGQATIQVSGSCARGRQFLLLCSGEQGPSYRGTCFFSAERVGSDGEILRGGDYENNDGSGGAALVEGLTSGGEYLQVASPGLLVGAHSSQTHRLAVFGVILSAWGDHKTDTAFGRVTSGLATLRAAARHDPVTEVQIVDCGLVIPL